MPFGFVPVPIFTVYLPIDKLPVDNLPIDDALSI